MAVGFVVKKEHVFAWPVSIKQPAESGSGGFNVLPIVARFKVVKASREKDILEEISAGRDPDVSLVKEFFVGWDKGVLDESGAELPYSEEARDAILEFPYAKNAITAAYYEAMAGKKAKTKN